MGVVVVAASYLSPTKSRPPRTLAVGKLPGSMIVESLAVYASAVPGPPKSAWV